MSTEENIIELRIKVLSKMLTSIIHNDQELSGNLELLFTQLSTTPDKDLVLTFSRWLANQSPEIKQYSNSVANKGKGSQLVLQLKELQESFHRKDPTGEELLIQTRSKLLAEIMGTIVSEDFVFSGNLELLLRQLKRRSQRDFIIILSRWLANQSPVTLNLAGAVSLQSNASPLEQQLTLLKEELVVGNAMGEGRIRSTYMSEIFGDLAHINVPLSVIHQETQHFNHVDMAYVCAIPKLRGAKKIFEIGTYRGQTTCGFTDVCDQAIVYTLNLPPEQDDRYGEFIGSFIQHSPNKDRIHQIFSDSQSFDPKPYQKSMDFIFIDGDHSYEFVKNDSEKAFELMAPNGAIAWHDFAGKSEGVVRYLKELAREKPLMRIRNTCLILYIDNMDFDTFAWKSLYPSLEEREYG